MSELAICPHCKHAITAQEINFAFKDPDLETKLANLKQLFSRYEIEQEADLDIEVDVSELRGYIINRYMHQ